MVTTLLQGIVCKNFVKRERLEKCLTTASDGLRVI
jgi:hypothetical protein